MILSTEWLIAIAVGAFVLLIFLRRKGGHKIGSFFTGIAARDVNQNPHIIMPATSQRPEPSGKGWLDGVSLLLTAIAAVAAALAIYQFFVPAP